MESNKNNNNKKQCNNNQIIKKKILIDQEKLFSSINKLPIELYDIIKSYIPLYVWRPLNKNLYVEYYNLVYIKLNSSNSENYIRNIVVRDLYYPFKFIIFKNIFKWIEMKNYCYNFYIYPNYISFLKDFCYDNDSFNCLNLLNKVLLELGFKKNKSKKNIKRIL